MYKNDFRQNSVSPQCFKLIILNFITFQHIKIFRSDKNREKEKKYERFKIRANTFFRGTSDRKIRLHHRANVPFIYSSMTLARHKECISSPFTLSFSSKATSARMVNLTLFLFQPPPLAPHRCKQHEADLPKAWLTLSTRTARVL